MSNIKREMSNGPTLPFQGNTMNHSNFWRIGRVAFSHFTFDVSLGVGSGAVSHISHLTFHYECGEEAVSQVSRFTFDVSLVKLTADC